MGPWRKWDSSKPDGIHTPACCNCNGSGRVNGKTCPSCKGYGA